MKNGIVIGKFYPPHLGHKFLIDSAKAKCENLTILVCDSQLYSIPAYLRAKWLMLIHPDCTVRIIPDIGKDDDSIAWAQHTIKFLGYSPNVVFSSEYYGIEYARYMNCKHIMVDVNRQNINISGTSIRNDMMANWNYLHPVVKAHYALRICVLGAESTGTTTLSRDLAKHYQTSWVPEFGRMYTESLIFNYNWKSSDFEFIAKLQNQFEDQCAMNTNKVLICDTNSWVTNQWHNRYMTKESEKVLSYSKGRHYDLYILTGDEIPFVQDGIRNGEDIRHQMHQTFLKKLRKNYNTIFIPVAGDQLSRLESSIHVIDSLIQNFKFK